MKGKTTMIKSKKIVAVILGVAMLLGGSLGTVMADEGEDLLLNLLESGQSRLILEDYKALAIAKEDVDILNSSGEIIGRLEKDSVADIVDFENLKMQYRIISGKVDGYVPMESLLRGKAAEYRAVELLRKENKNTDEDIKYEYTTYVSDKETGDKSFIVTVEGKLNTAFAIDNNEDIVSKDEIKEVVKENAKSDKKKETEETEETQEIQVSKRNIKYTKKDLNLLAAIVQCEVGGCSNELKKAVANVVLNRVEDSRFPNTIEKVIYARRQFTPAHNGRLSSVLRNGVDKSCINAAQSALDGDNNAEGYFYFDGRVHKGGYLKIGSVYFWKTTF